MCIGLRCWHRETELQWRTVCISCDLGEEDVVIVSGEGAKVHDGIPELECGNDLRVQDVLLDVVNGLAAAGFNN